MEDKEISGKPRNLIFQRGTLWDHNKTIRYSTDLPNSTVEKKPSAVVLKNTLFIEGQMLSSDLFLFTLPNVQGRIKGKCNITNARLHQGKKYHFCNYIKKFFPNMKYQLVYNMFLENNFDGIIKGLKISSLSAWT